MCPIVTKSAMPSAISNERAKLPKIATKIVNSIEWNMRCAGRKLNALRSVLKSPFIGRFAPF